MTDQAGFVAVCRASEIPNGRDHAVCVNGEDLLVVNLANTFHVIQNRCTHLAFPLENGRLIGTEIICRAHGARFDLRTGRPSAPAVDPLRVFDACVTDGMVHVRIAGDTGSGTKTDATNTHKVG